MNRLLTLLGAFLLLSSHSLFAQGPVTGKVTDSKGAPLAGISVKVEGSNLGTSTNADGSFSLAIPNSTVTLVFSGVGFSSKSIHVASGQFVSVDLVQTNTSLNEVVVTALGIKREKRALGYSTQTVGVDEINKSGTGNPISELQGKVSGLTVINAGGDPGSGTYMRLRGITSLTGDNQPLMVVDGVPIDNSINNFDPTSATPNVSGANSNLTGGSQPTNRGVDINPSDIESITVLKGPAATALYGEKGASGALIITTKRGTLGEGKINVEVNSSITFDNANKLPELQNQYTQGTYIDPSTGTDFLAAPTWIGAGGTFGDGSPAVSPLTGKNIASGGARLSWGPNIDTMYFTGVPNAFDKNGNLVGQSSPLAKTKASPYNEFNFFQQGVTYNNNIAISGGGETSTFRMSLGNVNQKGIVPNSAYNKTTFSLSGQTKVNEKLTASAGINFITSNNSKVQQGSNLSGIMLGLLRTPPTFDNSQGYVMPDGTGNQRTFRGVNGAYDNPYWTVNRNPNTSDLNRVFGFGQASYQLLKWMVINYRVGGDFYSQADKLAYDIHSGAFPAGAIYLNNYSNAQVNSDLTVTMKHDFSKDLTGSLLVGQNYFYNKSTSTLSSGSGFVLPEFYDISNATSYLNGPNTEAEKLTRAYYADAEFGFKRMLYLSLTAREEKSSSLPANHSNFFYPSAGLSWIFTELPELKNKSTLSFGKVRISAAQVGKDAPVQALQTYYKSGAITDGFTPGISFPINGSSGYSISTTISTIGNPDLKPEQTTSYEGGLDLGFFNNRLNFSGTYYYEKTIDEIFTVPLAYSSGFASKIENAGVVTNSGVELSLNAIPVRTKDFQWAVTVNWSKNVNKVVSLAPGVQKILVAGFTNGEIDAIAGQPFGVIYGSKYVRADNSNTLLISDVNDLGKNMPIAGTQTGAIGNVNPKWNGSLINTLTYKAFTLGFQIDWRHGGDIWNGTRGAIDYFGTGKATANRNSSTVFQGLTGHLNGNGDVVHFAADGTTEIAGPGAANTTSAALNQYYWQNIGSSFVGPTESDVQDGSFLKLRQLSLGYSLPKEMISHVGFKAISFTVFMNNVLLWTKYTGVDPETSLAGPANGQGLDYFNNPGTRSFGLRLNLGL
jgi:TonB-linked SusC/RagA family outer membrane protein